MPKLSQRLLERMRGQGLVSVSEAEKLSGFDGSTIRAWLASGRVIGCRAGSLWFVALKSLNKVTGLVIGRKAS